MREELGISLDKLGDSSAIPILERVVTDAPERFAARLALGLRYLRVKDPARSTDALERYLRSRPASASQIDTEVRERLAQGYLLLGRWQSAIREYEMVQKSKRDDVVVRIGLATALVGAGDCNRAVPLLEPIAATGAQPSAWYNLAKCYLSMGRKADAREMARRYTIAKPSDPKGQELAKQTAE